MSLMKIALYSIINHTDSPIVVIQPFPFLSLLPFPDNALHPLLSSLLQSLFRSVWCIVHVESCVIYEDPGLWIPTSIDSLSLSLILRSNNSRENRSSNHASYPRSLLLLNFPNFFPFFPIENPHRWYVFVNSKSMGDHSDTIVCYADYCQSRGIFYHNNSRHCRSWHLSSSFYYISKPITLDTIRSIIRIRPLYKK